MAGHDASLDNAKGITTFAMKTIALLLVMLGSFGTAVLLPGIGDLATADMGALTGVVLTDAFSWCAVPLYAWMLVNGFRRTHAAGWYLARLAVLAAVSEVPYDMATSGRFFDMTSQNPVWGLCIALIALMVLRAFQGAPRRGVMGDSDCGAARGHVMGVPVQCGVAARSGRRGTDDPGVRRDLLHAGQARENTMMLTAGAFGACMFILPVLGVMLLHWRSRREGYPAPWGEMAVLCAVSVATAGVRADRHGVAVRLAAVGRCGCRTRGTCPGALLQTLA